MKAVLVIAALAVLTACASPPVALQGKPSVTGLDMVATLATNDCEARTAPHYTALIVTRRRAATQVRAGAMDVGRAAAVQAAADEARAALDAACATRRLDEASLQAALRAEARLAQLMEIKHGP